jgi:hypothetical protein
LGARFLRLTAVNNANTNLAALGYVQVGTPIYSVFPRGQ